MRNNILTTSTRILLLFLLSGSVGIVSAQTWIDITDDYVVNPRFDNNDRVTGWSGTPFGAANPAENAEHYNKTYDSYQDILGLTAGRYRVSLSAFYRMGSAANDYKLYSQGNYDEYQYAQLYAASSVGEYETAIAPASSAALEYSLGGNVQRVGTWGDVKYLPNDMRAAYYWFNEGYYRNTVECQVGNDGVLTIGIRKDANIAEDWTCLDDWKLEYYGTLVKATSVTMEKTLTMNMSETYQMNPVISPNNVTYHRLQWTSNNPDIVSVDNNGLLRALKEGTATITATTTDGSNKKATCSVTVIKNNPTAASVVINEICAANLDVYRDPSTNFGSWVELYNPSDVTVVLGQMYVSDDPANLKKNRLIDSYGILPAHGYAILNFDHFEVWKPASYRQIDDKLNVEGGTIILSDGTNIIAQQTYPQAIGRTSYARTTDGGSTWGISAEPTPGKTNENGRFATMQLETPVVDKDGQFFTGNLNVRVNIPAGCTLRYTTDGTVPTWNSGAVSSTGTFNISKTTCFRFRLFRDGYIPSEVVTRSYIVQGNYPFPVISVVTPIESIYGSEYGLFEMGDNGRPGNGQSGNCNWNMAWDRPVNMEFINTEGEYLISQECDMSMCGGWSRGWTPHSFKLKANKQYSLKNAFEAWFFKEKPFLKEKTLQIRNGGNDTGCRIKDAALQQIAARSGLHIDYQAWQPVHVFLNGQHYAVLNMREPNNKHYAYANYGIDTDEMDQFEMSPDSGYVQMSGTEESFQRLVELSEDASNDAVYQEICQLLDIDEYINYMAVEMYLGGNDWPQNNVKGFRDVNDGKFHFVLFDLDGTFNTTNPFNDFANREYWTFDPLYGTDYSTGTNITGTRNYRPIKFVTLFKNMLTNSTFRKRFIDAFCVVAASVYSPDKSREIISEMSNYLGTGGYVNPTGTANQLINSLSSSRINTLTNSLKNYSPMGLGSTAKQAVDLSANIEGATLMVNDMTVPYSKLEGYLFSPVQFKAIAPAGYRFEGWSSSEMGTSTKTIIANGDSWKYNDSENLDGKQWYSATYNDASWNNGLSPIGYGKAAINTTTATNKTCYYFRKNFTLDSEQSAEQVFILDYTIDDGMVVYVNGVEATRYNMPAGTVYYNTVATTYANNNPDTGSAQLPASLFHKGTNVIAVEVHNNNVTSTDIMWDASLTTVVSGEPSFVSRDAVYNMPTNGSVRVKAIFSKMDSETLQKSGVVPVRINEVSAGNDFNVNDSYKKEDWVELYNTTDQDVDVQGMILTGNNNSQYYKINGDKGINTVIPAHGTLILWCDKMDAISQLHAPFKLDNSDGSSISIQSQDGTWEDKMVYLEQPRWHSYGRYPDGAAFNGLMSVPTIGKSNKWTAEDTSIMDPLDWVDTDQTVILALSRGWNWVSHNMDSDVDRTRLTGYAQYIKSQHQDVYKDSKLGWIGTLNSLNPQQSYKVQMNSDADVTLRGQIYDSQRTVRLVSGWNWIGFPLYNSTNITAALQNYLATEGDQIIGLDQMATYSGGRWSGTLTSLVPGQGYMLKSAREQELRWNSLSQVMQKSKRYAAPVTQRDNPWELDIHQYPNVMGMIARVEIDGEEAMDGSYRIGAFWGDECRGVATMCDGLLYMNIHGEGGEPLQFRMMDIEGSEYVMDQKVLMSSLSTLGTAQTPYLLSLTTGDATGIESVSLGSEVVSTEYYNLGGQRISRPETMCLRKTTYRDGRVVTKKIITNK